MSTRKTSGTAASARDTSSKLVRSSRKTTSGKVVRKSRNTPVRTSASLNSAIRSATRAIESEMVNAKDSGILTHGDQVDAFVKRALATLPRVSPLAEAIGPFYDTAGLRQWLNISKQALAKRVEKAQVLGCKTVDGHWVYPAWQFDDQGEVVEGLSEVLSTLLEQRDTWAAAHWFVVPSPDLDGFTAIEWLAQGNSPEPVLREAVQDTERLAS